jgi:hypothetical protein
LDEPTGVFVGKPSFGLARRRGRDPSPTGYSRTQAEYLRRGANDANSSLIAAKEQFESGLKGFTDVLIAEQNLFSAQTNWVVARGNVSLGATAI